MDSDAKVLEAVALLRQAGRMDLLKEEALVPGRPACRASAGVAAAVAACSLPRAAGGLQVRGVAWGGGREGWEGCVRGGQREGREAWVWAGIPKGFPRGGATGFPRELGFSSTR
ncbi:hypothetical protein NDU88_007847 [Pleurodeles waltl]|uniref:Uncharacterized protein n=1 Tax=Pleurodeles waltl TaxID=8319 RepID=A0AAV7NX62_PLEWA|nr:hypothetical protein NDU88_007847 [Pleurodeles waltl]